MRSLSPDFSIAAAMMKPTTISHSEVLENPANEPARLVALEITNNRMIRKPDRASDTAWVTHTMMANTATARAPLALGVSAAVVGMAKRTSRKASVATPRKIQFLRMCTSIVARSGC